MKTGSSSHKLAKKNKLNVVGIMNGTSLDGVDFVLCQIQKRGKNISIKFQKQEHVKFSVSLRALLLGAARHELHVQELGLVHHQLGRFYAESLSAIKKKKKWKFDLIGLHGQTVLHAPPHATLQIGEPSYLSSELAVPVVSNFRVADLAAGGQGAPIASLFHQVAFTVAMKKKNFSLHNLGGISNLTFISKKGTVERAFDTGPANMLLDMAARYFSSEKNEYDHDGEMAKRGIAHQELVDELMGEDFIMRSPPKSCGREEFGENFFKRFLESAGAVSLSAEDAMATLVEFTAKSIAVNYKLFCKPVPEAVILCGGGAKNSFLVSRIHFHLSHCQVLTTQDFGWPVDAIEGAAFALLAAYRIWEIPNNIPKTTGAKKLVKMGVVTEI